MMSTDPRQLQQYVDCGWQLIPLHRHDYFDQPKGKSRPRGKSPLHVNWTTRSYRNADQVGHMSVGHNVGVRLRAGDLVIDVDPRNFAEGDDPLRRLADDTGTDFDAFPHVVTGSGGSHYYMRKPADVSVRDTLEGYDGVEFKTLGRQVVAAGSLHPDTKLTYAWDPLAPCLRDCGGAPERLLNVIRRPQSGNASVGGGEYDQAEVARMLDALDPEEFRGHQEWLELMMACHHASAGDARAEFVEWSTRDPEYRDHGTLIGRRWDSLHAAGHGGPQVTHRTLLKALTDRGLGEQVPRTPPADDFQDDPDFAAAADGDTPEHERKGPLERMNDKYWAVLDGGKFRVLYEDEDPSLSPPRKYWQRVAPYDFRMMLANRRVQKGERTVPLADAWLEWSGRKTAEGVIFDPERSHEGRLNLWTGWGVTPVKGDWSLLDALLHEALCDGDDAVHRYVLDWAAHMVQRPARPAEVAVCFQGGMGVGKGTFGRALMRLAGRHGMHITSPEHLTGRFNAHLRDVVLLFADEAINPYDKSAESRLRGLITEPAIAFEAKGRDVETSRNHLHVVMASNEDWFVPAALEGERRFLLSHANATWQGRHDRFAALNDQLDGGGLGALLFDLLNRDIGGWSPRRCVPVTGETVRQKLRGLSPVGQWWFNALCEGEPPCEPTRADADWFMEPIRMFRRDMRESFGAYCHASGIRPGASGRGLEMVFAAEMKKLCPGIRDKLRDTVPDDRPDLRPHSDGRAWASEIPPLCECRATMDAILGKPYDW